MTERKLTLYVFAIIVSAAVLGAFLGQLFPQSGPLYLLPVGLSLGISIRLIARWLAGKREN